MLLTLFPSASEKNELGLNRCVGGEAANVSGCHRSNIDLMNVLEFVLKECGGSAGSSSVMGGGYDGFSYGRLLLLTGAQSPCRR